MLLTKYECSIIITPNFKKTLELANNGSTETLPPTVITIHAEDVTIARLLAFQIFKKYYSEMDGLELTCERTTTRKDTKDLGNQKLFYLDLLQNIDKSDITPFLDLKLKVFENALSEL